MAKLGPAVKIKTPAHPARMRCKRNKSAQQSIAGEWVGGVRQRVREREPGLAHVLPFQRHLTLFWCFFFFLYFSQADADIPSPTHVREPPPRHTHSLHPRCSCIISKICRCLLPGQAQKRSRRNRKFNFIFMSCNPATRSPPPPPPPPLPSQQSTPVTLSSFCGVIQPPNGLCKKFNNRNTLGTRKSGTTQRNQPRSDKATKRRSGSVLKEGNRRGQRELCVALLLLLLLQIVQGALAHYLAASCSPSTVATIIYAFASLHNSSKCGPKCDA